MRRHRFAFAFLLVLALVPFAAPLLRQEVFVVRDHFDYFQPLRAFTAAELSQGSLPLWNPWNASGEPWLANPQTGIFYPPAWMFVVLPFPTAYMLFLLFHLVVLGWGAHLLFVRSVSPGAAMVGAAALMFSGPVLSLLDVSNNLATLSWVPLALWCAAERHWRRGAVVLTLAFLGGEPFFAALAGVLFAVVAIASAPAGGRGRAAAAVALAGLSAFGLSAVQLLPFLEMLRGSDRAGSMDASLILRESMPLRDWLRIAVPPAPGPSLIDPHLGQHFIPVVYIGMATLVLALAGLTDRRRWRLIAGWVALAVTAAFVASGPELLVRLPLTLFRYPARLVPFAALAIAALASLGWERLRRRGRWLDLLVVLVVVADLTPRVRPLLRSAAWSSDVVPYAKAIGSEAKILRVGDVDPLRRAAWMSGYLNLYDRRYEVFTPAPLSSENYMAMHRQLQSTPTAEQLHALGVGWVLTRHPLTRPFEPVAQVAGVTMFRYQRAAPLATLRLTGGGVTPLTPEIGTSSARVTVDAPAPGMVVISQQGGPGWRVSVDGRRATGVLFEGLFRAVRVPAGRHEVAWDYRPLSLYAGAVMTIVTLLALQFSVFVKTSRE